MLLLDDDEAMLLLLLRLRGSNAVLLFPKRGGVDGVVAVGAVMASLEGDLANAR